MRPTNRRLSAPPAQRAASIFWSLRFRSLLLVLLAVIPALFLLGYTARQQRRMAAERMQDTTLRLVRLVASDVQGRVEGARELLTTLAELPAIRQGDPVESERVLRRLLKQHPAYANMGVIAPNGDVVASALPRQGKVNLAGRSYFQRAVKSGKFVVGDYQTGHITNSDTLNFAYPVRDAEGRLQVVVFAALRLDWVSRFSQWNLPDNTTLTIVNDRGAVLLGYPNPEHWSGRQLPNEELLRRVFSATEGTSEGLTLDTAPRVIAFTRLHVMSQTRPAAVILGVPMDAVYSQIDWVFLRSLIGMGLVAILGLVAAWVGGDWFFLRQVQALVAAAGRIRSGDLTARTGLRYGRDELSHLTLAFDAMADSLEHLTGRHELILASAGEGIYGVDAQGRTTFVNPAAGRMLGYSPEEMIGKSHHALIHHTRQDGSPYPEDECPIVQTYRMGVVNHGDDEIFWRKDGTWFPVDYVATPVREHGALVGAVVTFKDVTQRKESERELMHAHEEVLGIELEKKRFYREVIRSVSKNKLHLVDPEDIPHEGRLIAEGGLENPEDDRAARKCIRGVAVDAGMSMDRARELTLAVGEATTNAVKHATGGRYEVFLTDDRVVVRVSDEGQGINTEDLPASLLEPGYSTKVSMGMGYTLMLELADRVWLTTGPWGTTIQLEKWIQPAERPKSGILTAVERMQSAAP